MIYVTVGACMGFDRLLHRIDELAPHLDEKIIMQTGRAEFQSSNCECFAFKPDIAQYYQQARLVISHGGFATLEVMKMSKPLLVVPRQLRYGEHYNDHQVEFAELLNRKYDVKCIMDVQDLDVELVRDYSYVADYNSDNLNRFRETIHPILLGKSSSTS